MEIKIDDLGGAEIKALLQRHMDEMVATTPPGSCHYLDLNGLRAPEVTLWSLWEKGSLLGCGALQQLDIRHGEIKSMHVHSDHRGKGIAEIMLKHILKVAGQRGYTRLSLETGALPAFVPARRLYEKYRFGVCAAFGDYKNDSINIYMSKVL